MHHDSKQASFARHLKFRAALQPFVMARICELGASEHKSLAGSVTAARGPYTALLSWSCSSSLQSLASWLPCFSPQCSRHVRQHDELNAPTK